METLPLSASGSEDKYNMKIWIKSLEVEMKCWRNSKEGEIRIFQFKLGNQEDFLEELGLKLKTIHHLSSEAENMQHLITKGENMYKIIIIWWMVNSKQEDSKLWFPGLRSSAFTSLPQAHSPLPLSPYALTHVDLAFIQS